MVAFIFACMRERACKKHSSLSSVLAVANTRMNMNVLTNQFSAGEWQGMVIEDSTPSGVICRGTWTDHLSALLPIHAKCPDMLMQTCRLQNVPKYLKMSTQCPSGIPYNRPTLLAGSKNEVTFAWHSQNVGAHKPQSSCHFD